MRKKKRRKKRKLRRMRKRETKPRKKTRKKTRKKKWKKKRKRNKRRLRQNCRERLARMVCRLFIADFLQMCCWLFIGYLQVICSQEAILTYPVIICCFHSISMVKQNALLTDEWTKEQTLISGWGLLVYGAPIVFNLLIFNMFLLIVYFMNKLSSNQILMKISFNSPNKAKAIIKR